MGIIWTYSIRKRSYSKSKRFIVNKLRSSFNRTMNLVVVLTVITILTLNAGNATAWRYDNKGCDDRPAFKKELSETYKGCGPCYGAKSTKIPCCNTCNDIQDAYIAKIWHYHYTCRQFPQCAWYKVPVH